MALQRKIRTIFIIIAAIVEMMIAVPSIVYLKLSIYFFLVISTAVFSTCAIAYFVLKHGDENTSG